MQDFVIETDFVDFEALASELSDALGGPGKVGLSASVTEDGTPRYFTGRHYDPGATMPGADYGPYTEHRAVVVHLDNPGDLDKAKAIVAAHSKKHKGK